MRAIGRMYLHQLKTKPKKAKRVPLLQSAPGISTTKKKKKKKHLAATIPQHNGHDISFQSLFNALLLFNLQIVLALKHYLAAGHIKHTLLHLPELYLRGRNLNQ